MAKEFGLNALHLEALGESCQWEIVVGGDILERLVEIQCQFKRLAVMGDDEYRGFYIEVSRPTPEEWGDAGELIASGEYDGREAFLADWLAFNPLETLFDYLQRLIDVVVANPDGFNDYVAHNLPYQQRIGVLHKRNLTA